MYSVFCSSQYVLRSLPVSILWLAWAMSPGSFASQLLDCAVPYVLAANEMRDTSYLDTPWNPKGENNYDVHRKYGEGNDLFSLSGLFLSLITPRGVITTVHILILERVYPASSFSCLPLLFGAVSQPSKTLRFSLDPATRFACSCLSFYEYQDIKVLPSAYAVHFACVRALSYSCFFPIPVTASEHSMKNICDMYGVSYLS